MHVFLLLSALIINAKEPDFNSFKLKLDKALSAYNKANYSYSFYNLSKEKEITSYNADKLFSIASVSKLFITGAALKYLGASYKFKTNVYIDSENNLYIKGSGDPVFVSENMWFLVNELINFGIKSIKNIYLDDTLFKELTYDYVENDRAYSAIVSPLMVNFNAVAINVTAGKNPFVSLDPTLDFLKLEDKTLKNSKKTNVEVRRYDNRIVVNGIVNGKDSTNKKIYRNISDPIENFSSVLKLHLSYRDIKIEGEIKKQKLSETAKFLFSVDSKRLPDLLTDMNRYSSNLIAEELFLAVANKVTGSATYIHGQKTMLSYLKDLGLDTSSVKIENGSGLSAGNKATSNFIVQYLKKLSKNISNYPEFISSLSISGVDGTISKTIDDELLVGRIRAKTGTINNVRAIAGFINNADDVYAFSININQAGANDFIYKEEDVFKRLIN